MSFDYYYGEQSESFRFLRVSRLLLTPRSFAACPQMPSCDTA